MFSITSTLNDNSSANFNKSISFGVSTAIWKEPDSFSSWRCHYVDNSSIVLKRYDICMRGSREGSGILIDSFLQNSHCKITKNMPHTPTHPRRTQIFFGPLSAVAYIIKYINVEFCHSVDSCSVLFIQIDECSLKTFIFLGFFLCSSFSTAISDDDNITFHCLLHKTINESLIYLHAIQGKLNMHAFILTAGHVLFV